MVGKRHDESTEELFLVIGHELAAAVRARAAFPLRRLQLHCEESR
jgi:hypothetical protein